MPSPKPKPPRPINGTKKADVLNGTAGNDTIDGREGNDTIRGGEGDDTIFGGSGDDTIFSGLGADQLWGNDGADFFIYTDFSQSAGSTGVDVIHDLNPAEGDYVDITGLGSVTLLSSYQIGFVGNQATLSFDAVANQTTFAIYNGSSSPVFVLKMAGFCDAENPGINGLTIPPPPPPSPSDPRDFDGKATGSTIQIVDIGFDQWDYYGTSGADVITPDPAHQAFVYGGAGADVIDMQGVFLWAFGGSGDDTILAGWATWGGSGDDIITSTYGFFSSIAGGYGADILNGRADVQERYRYYSALDGGDTINGFETGSDLINLQELERSVGLTFQGLITDEDELGAGGVGYLTTDAGLTVLVDTDGVAGADLIINLAGATSLAAGDFELPA